MDWKEEMKKGMLMIQSACRKNHKWSDCWECPFGEHCDDIYVAPEDWNLESEDN